FIVGGPVGDFELLLCHGTVCVVGKMRDLILQLSKSSIYSTKPIREQIIWSIKNSKWLHCKMTVSKLNILSAPFYRGRYNIKL
ncbi:hypothetical protein ACV2XY_22540, partial [Escherichia coli]